MSADNGIYILKTRDQYRVAHFRNAEYMSYSAITQSYDSNRIISTRVVELWGDCKYTRSESTALHLAHKWAGSLPVCEYGVNVIPCDKTWKQILKDARVYAIEEIKVIKERNCEEFWDMERLQKIAEGYYLDEWVHRQQRNTYQ